MVLGLLSPVPALVRISSGSPMLPMTCSQANAEFLTAFHSFIQHLSVSLQAKPVIHCTKPTTWRVSNLITFCQFYLSKQPIYSPDSAVLKGIVHPKCSQFQPYCTPFGIISVACTIQEAKKITDKI